jgi:transcriptional regulator with XRE-family HTH domain
LAAGVLTLPRLYLGVVLKGLRADSGKTLDEVAAVIGKSRARLITVLDGKGTLTTAELSRLLDFLGVGPAQKNELLKLGVETRGRPARRRYADLLPDEYERVADLESIATEIWSYERGVIPGLLQIPEYVEAVMADADGIWWEPSWEERRNRITFRLERQKLIMEADADKILHFVISDDALRTDVGGPETMRRQLEHLLSLMDSRPNISIRLISSTVPHNPVPSGGVILLRLGVALPPLALLPLAYGPSAYVDDPTDTARLRRARSKVEELAMSPEDSRKVIADLARRT